MRDYVEASDRVTNILIRLGAGQRVDPDEIVDSRRLELIATTRYTGTLVSLGAAVVAEEGRSDADAAEDDP